MSRQPAQIEKFVREVIKALPHSSVGIDEPINAEGEWFIDLACEGFSTSVAWRASLGFGLFTAAASFGERPNEVFRRPEIAALRISQLHRQWESSHLMTPAWLAQLRQLTGTAQTDLAAALDLNQPAISRFEKRDDVKLSTLNAYVEAMGGRLEMRVHFEDLDMALALPSLSG